MFKSSTSYQDDFWSQLQKDWDKAAEEDPSLGWLKGTPLDPVDEVYFIFYICISHFNLSFKN